MTTHFFEIDKLEEVVGADAFSKYTGWLAKYQQGLKGLIANIDDCKRAEPEVQEIPLITNNQPLKAPIPSPRKGTKRPAPRQTKPRKATKEKEKEKVKEKEDNGESPTKKAKQKEISDYFPKAKQP